MTLPYDRSTRRTTKLGSYGELLLEHWLSRSGFHTARADAEGIDVLAVHKGTNKRLGISMKARFYPEFKQAGLLNKHSLEKVTTSCGIWAAEPWLAAYVESSTSGMLVAMSLQTYMRNHVYPDSTWYMLNIRPDAVGVLRQDPEVQLVEFDFAGNWFVSHLSTVAL